MNLSETDKEKINRINDLLLELKPLLYDLKDVVNNDCYVPYNPFYNIKPAVDVVEPEYVECVLSKINATFGKIYKRDKEGFLLLDDNVSEHYPVKCGRYFKPSTKEAYLAQQKEVEKEWKVGQIVKDKDNNYAVIVETRVTEVVCDNYSPHGRFMTIDKDRIYTTTEKEAEDWLKGIAERKYPVGTKFKSVFNDVVIEEVTSGNFIYENNTLYADGGISAVWKGKWAEISEPKPEERFKPKAAREVYFYISDYGEIMKAEFFNDYLDTERYKIGNCFQTEEQAQSAATKIRKILLGV